jgi:hypothetical protein
MRWIADGFEIARGNVGVVRAAFAPDTVTGRSWLVRRSGRHQRRDDP